TLSAGSQARDRCLRQATIVSRSDAGDQERVRPERRAQSGPYGRHDLMTDAISFEADLSKCVRCGLCLQHCPTYVETGLETESPRGRLYLIKAMAEGLIEPTVNVTGHMDMCLQCRNCEAVCPSGVPYGRIMEHGRAHVLHTGR